MLVMFILSLVVLGTLTALVLVSAGSNNSLAADPDAAFVIKCMYVLFSITAAIGYIFM